MVQIHRNAFTYIHKTTENSLIIFPIPTYIYTLFVLCWICISVYKSILAIFIWQFKFVCILFPINTNAKTQSLPTKQSKHMKPFIYIYYSHIHTHSHTFWNEIVNNSLNKSINFYSE